MSSHIPGHRALLKSAAVAIAAALALTACTTNSTQQASSSSQSPANDEATVSRVIDGDTFVATTREGEKTIRLLNVDTPETKDPNAPVECLGPEATTALEQLLPVGSVVRLELDVEPTDKYGRTLAGVFDSSGTLINAEVARQGLGVPMLIEPNRKFYPAVEEAFDEARTRAVGLNSTDLACLPAQQVEKAVAAVETITAVPLSESTSALDKSNAGLATALATIAALKAASEAKGKVHWAAYQPAKLAQLVSRLNTSASAATARQATIKGKKKSLADAAAAAKAARVKAESAAKSAAAKMAAEAAAAAKARAAADAAAAEAERIRNLPPVYVPPAPPVYVPPVYEPPAAPAPVTDPYPGYTGPRCYAPGGKTWRPCG
ncbi:thermonuclease family protein [Arthrobacter sp. ISL-65]|uniref:thermonuclease family protein n=1 Tax=Arthrobacter sp. ISL-65 TaxID=2819112 RepID=UPI001BE7F850|nr:thermonuclease family protein [Arthrobacter sp. ISL-65]MBT2549088.1 thermonuclease family protein [Arthrobacter sp. ISL-65]